VVPLAKLNEFNQRTFLNSDSAQQIKPLLKNLQHYMLKYLVVGGQPDQPPAQRLNFLIGRDKQNNIVFVPAEPGTLKLRLQDKQVLPATPGEPKPRPFQLQIRGLHGPLTLQLRPVVYVPKGVNITLFRKNDLLLLLEFSADTGGLLSVGQQEIALRAKPDGLVYTDAGAAVKVLDDQHKGRAYKIGESFLANGHLVTLRHISAGGDSLTVQVAESAKVTRVFGSDAGFAFQPATLADVQGRAVSLTGTERPLVLDFWGTWCGPCVALTPNLKALHQQYAATADIVSIALDDADKVKQYLASNTIGWTNIAIPQKQAEASLINRLGVEDYPTFILIHKGVIQYRGTGETGLKELTQQLAQLK
jgi:thiol-disulfide isomerase/thioredoxin